MQRTSGQDLVDPFDYQSIIDTYTVDGATTTSTYDKSARTDTTVSPMGRTSEVEYDAGDRPTRVSSPGRDDVTVAYDGRGRPTTVTQGTAQSTVTYGADGRASQTVDAEGGVTTIVRDAVGQPTSVTGPDGETTGYVYDDAGQLTSTTAPDGRAFSFEYDENGNQTAEHRPAITTSPAPALTTSVEYDVQDRATKVTSPSGDEVQLLYDSAGRQHQTQATDGTSATAAFQAGGARQLQSLTTGDGIQTGFVLDGPLVTQVTTSGDGDAPSAQVSVGVGYDSSLRPISETIDGDAVAVAYNNDEQPTQIGDLAISYDATTGDANAAVAGASTTTFSTDNRGDLAAQTSVADQSGTAAPVFSETLTRDQLGRITTRTETVGSGAPVVHGYSYDAAGRLTQVQSGGSATETYAYDSTGGLTSRGNGVLSSWIQSDDYGRAVATANGITASWSTDGELTALTLPGQAASALTYDGFGRIKTITTPAGTTGTYSYDGAGRRLALRVDGQIQRRYLYGADFFPRARIDADGDVIERYIYASQSHVPDLIERRDGQRLRLITDALGSIRAVVDIDTGAVVQQLAYDAYGTVTQDTAPGTQPFGFKGAMSDPVAEGAGLVWMGTRAYQPSLARFATPEPLGVAVAWNEHEAFAGDPVNLTDSDGLFPSFGPSLSDAAAGFGDSVTFGATNWVRGKLGWNDNVDKCSDAYNNGGNVGDWYPIGGGRAKKAGKGLNKIWNKLADDTGSIGGGGRKKRPSKNPPGDSEHTKNARPSSKPKHEKGQSRKQRDQARSTNPNKRRPQR